MKKQLSDYDFKTGEVLLIDKPLGWTSFDVVNKVRYRLKNYTGDKKIKVGHAGTLDPLATGLLIVCTGKMTKQIDQFMGFAKAYTGTITLGATRPSYDMESEIDATFTTHHLNTALLEEARLSFLGEQEQLPPVFSAIKQDGKPIYLKAREGEQITVQPRKINILDFQLTDTALPKVDFYVHCSKGTYIRSLAYDFGQRCYSGAYLSRLCRVSIGDFQLSDAWNLEELIQLFE